MPHELEHLIIPEDPNRVAVREATYRLLQKREGIFVEMVTGDPWITLEYPSSERSVIDESLRSFAGSMYPGRDVELSELRVLYNSPSTDFSSNRRITKTTESGIDRDEELAQAFQMTIRRFSEQTTPFKVLLTVDCNDEETEREREMRRDDLPDALYLRNEHIVRLKSMVLEPYGDTNMCIVPQLTLDQWLKSPDYERNVYEIHMPHYQDFDSTLYAAVANEIDKATNSYDQEGGIEVDIQYT